MNFFKWKTTSTFLKMEDNLKAETKLSSLTYFLIICLTNINKIVSRNVYQYNYKKAIHFEVKLIQQRLAKYAYLNMALPYGSAM